ncbi:hypothetical protein PIROE2DRAFT_16966 [Piromyces sp. E2]|nr:hypothetical protein PIROE2DRAFT_16966 [Piromyces sp. E2]|eukprot:OUM57901.1 hypothetical protein PIROE2DRAFT_16966 [Piromyces sp. E2]
MNKSLNVMNLKLKDDMLFGIESYRYSYALYCDRSSGSLYVTVISNFDGDSLGNS